MAIAFEPIKEIFCPDFPFIAAFVSVNQSGRFQMNQRLPFVLWLFCRWGVLFIQLQSGTFFVPCCTVDADVPVEAFLLFVFVLIYKLVEAPKISLMGSAALGQIKIAVTGCNFWPKVKSIMPMPDSPEQPPPLYNPPSEVQPD